MELWENRAVKSHITSADDIHKKYFHRRQLPTTTGLPVKLNAGKPGTDYDSKINVHIYSDGVPVMSAV